MVEVHRLSHSLLLIHIDEHQLIDDILIEQGVCIAHAYHPAPDQHHFLRIWHFHCLLI